MDEEFVEDEQTTFVVDDVSNVIKESIEMTIGGNAYQHNKVFCSKIVNKKIGVICFTWFIRIKI